MVGTDATTLRNIKEDDEEEEANDSHDNWQQSHLGQRSAAEGWRVDSALLKQFIQLWRPVSRLAGWARRCPSSIPLNRQHYQLHPARGVACHLLVGQVAVVSRLLFIQLSVYCAINCATAEPVWTCGHSQGCKPRTPQRPAFYTHVEVRPNILCSIASMCCCLQRALIEVHVHIHCMSKMSLWALGLGLSLSLFLAFYFIQPADGQEWPQCTSSTISRTGWPCAYSIFQFI